MDSPPPPPPPPVLEEEPPPPPPAPIVVAPVIKPKVTARVIKPKTGSRPTQTRKVRRPPPKKSSGKAFMITKVIIISFLLLILALMLVPQLRDSPMQWLNPMSYRQFPETAEFTVERRMSISNVQSFGFDIPQAKNLPGAQRVVSTTTNPQPTTTMQKYGYDWMDWDASSGETISMTTTYRTWTVWWDINSDTSLTVFQARKYDPMYNALLIQYNHDEWRIETTHPDIIYTARQLEVPGGSVFDNLQSIFKYLNVNFEYSTRDGGGVKPSSETLNDRNGDCDDMSFLFVALAREMGIPAWPELGAMYNPLNREWVGHGWMEAYVPTTNGGMNVTIDMVNDEFLVRGANRFADFKSDGDGDHLQDYYFSYSFIPSQSQEPVISDNYVDRNYDTTGTVTVKLGHDGQPVPLFEWLLIFIVAIIAIVIILKVAKARRRGRRRARARR